MFYIHFSPPHMWVKKLTPPLTALQTRAHDADDSATVSFTDALDASVLSPTVDHPLDFLLVNFAVSRTRKDRAELPAAIVVSDPALHLDHAAHLKSDNHPPGEIGRASCRERVS